MSRPTPKRTLIPVVVHDGNSSISASESMTSAIPVPSLSTGYPSSMSGRSNESQKPPSVNAVNVLETDSTGNLVAPSLLAAEQAPVLFHCLFHMLPCDYQSDSLELWQTHVLSHFRGCRLPPVASCQWCAVDFNEENERRTWNKMLEHVAHEHFEKGHTLAASRPNFELMKYMYQSKIITEDQLKAVQLCPSPDSPAYHPSQDAVRASIGSSDEPYCSTYSPRREKRLREQRRGISVV